MILLNDSVGLTFLLIAALAAGLYLGWIPFQILLVSAAFFVMSVIVQAFKANQAYKRDVEHYKYHKNIAV